MRELAADLKIENVPFQPWANLPAIERSVASSHLPVEYPNQTKSFRSFQRKNFSAAFAVVLVADELALHTI